MLISCTLMVMVVNTPAEHEPVSSDSLGAVMSDLTSVQPRRAAAPLRTLDNYRFKNNLIQ